MSALRLGKEVGGCSIAWGGKSYTWKNDGAVIQVPAELGLELLAIRGGGYFEPQDEPEPVKVTEPAPPKAEVTEPAPPPAKAVTEDK